MSADEHPELKYWAIIFIVFIAIAYWTTTLTPQYNPQPTTYYKASYGSPTCLNCTHITNGYGVFIDETNSEYVVKDLR